MRRIRPRPRGCLLVLALVLSGCGSFGGGSEGKDQILFVMGGGQLVLVSDDGSDMHELTPNKNGWDIPRAIWSPAGERVAFTRQHFKNWKLREVWVVEADGSGERKLGPGAVRGWTNDGSKLLVERPRDPTKFSKLHEFPLRSQVVLVDLDRDGERVLTEDGIMPSFSADGLRVLFVRNRYGPSTPVELVGDSNNSAVGGECCRIVSSQIEELEPAGGKTRTLARIDDPDSYYLEPQSVPGAAAIAATVALAGETALRILPADGEPGRLLDNGVISESSSWSADGRVVYSVGSRLRLKRHGSSESRTLSVGTPSPFDPIDSISWAPDGKRIAATLFDGERSRLYVVDLPDGKPHLIVSNQTTLNSAAWRPRPDKRD